VLEVPGPGRRFGRHSQRRRRSATADAAAPGLGTVASAGRGAIGAAAVGQTRPNGYLAQAIATASVSRELARPLLAFVELLFNAREERGGREQLAANVGLVYRLTRSLAIDAGVQTSLAGQGPDYVVRTGLSVLWR